MKSLFVILSLFLFVGTSEAASYYTSASGGSDARSCATAQNTATPRLTINAGIACLTVAGDKLYIRAGTYAEKFNNPFPATGTAANPIIVTSYPGEVVTIKPTGYNAYIIAHSGNSRQYVGYDGLVLDGSLITSANCLGAPNQMPGILYISGAVQLSFTNMRITNSPCNGGLIEGDHLTILNVEVDNNGWSTSYGNSNGLYMEGITNSLVKNVNAHDNECFGIRIVNSATSPAANFNVVDHSISHHNGGKPWGSGGAFDCSSASGGFVIGDTGNIVQNSLAYENTNIGGYGFWQWKGVATCTGSSFFNNTSYHNLYGIHAGVNCNSMTFTNNLSVGNVTSNLYTSGSGTITLTTNRTTGLITDCAVSSTVFTQSATSLCLNAGTPILGHAYNDSAPDIGAFEKITFATCSVESGDASTVRVTFNNSANPPLSPATAITGFTVKKSGISDTVTGSQITGSNRLDLSLGSPIGGSDTVSISHVTSNLTDSARTANTINQPYVQVLTNQSCVNNVVGGGSTSVFTQTVFRFNGLRGTEAAPIATPYATAPENTNVYVVPGGSLRLRIGISCTIVDCPPTGFIPRYKKNAGTTTLLADTFGSDNIAFCGISPDPDIPNSGTATTQQLTGSGTFTAGALVRTSNAIPTINMVLGGRTEVEYCVAFSTMAVASDTYDILVTQQDGTPLVYSVTPRVTIIGSQYGSGF